MALRPSLPALIFVLTTFGIGCFFGARHGMAGCSMHDVDIGRIVLGNSAMLALLASGWVSLGISTITLGGLTLGGTGATAGAIISRLGVHGMLLLAPHGVIEICAAVLATDVGLTRALERSSAFAGLARGRPPVKAGVAVLLVFVAALVESAWTQRYGRGLSC